MKSKSLIAAVGTSALLVLTQVASAHPGHGTAGGFAAGVSHPLSGIDHILAMLAVGLCAVQIGGRALWMLPITFLAFMVGGGLFAVHGGAVPMIEQGIAVSVLLLGLLVAAGSRLALPVTAGFVGLFAFFHGFAHGAEMHAGLSPAAYGLGFVTATALLLSIGLAAGLLLKRTGWMTLARLAGAGIATCGIVLVCMS